MKKLIPFLAVIILLAAGCASKKNVQEEPYVRSDKKAYENRIKYHIFAPFMYERSFFAYYSLAKKIDGPNDKGFYRVQFVNGPKAGQELSTKNVLLKVRPAEASELRKGMVVLVNHWDPRTHDAQTPVDMWRKGVVYNLASLKDGLVMLEFPYDQNDFMATKETYSLINIWIIVNPKQRDPRVFL